MGGKRLAEPRKRGLFTLEDYTNHRRKRRRDLGFEKKIKNTVKRCGHTLEQTSNRCKLCEHYVRHLKRAWTYTLGLKNETTNWTTLYKVTEAFLESLFHQDVTIEHVDKVPEYLQQHLSVKSNIAGTGASLFSEEILNSAVTPEVANAMLKDDDYKIPCPIPNTMEQESEIVRDKAINSALYEIVSRKQPAIVDPFEFVTRQDDYYKQQVIGRLKNSNEFH
jgi:hypothetical protein